MSQMAAHGFPCTDNHPARALTASGHPARHSPANPFTPASKTARLHRRMDAGLQGNASKLSLNSNKHHKLSITHLMNNRNKSMKYLFLLVFAKKPRKNA
jgi:hypothetical protein